MTNTKTQTERLAEYLSHPGRELSAAQARVRFGVRNLRARMTDLRQTGYEVASRYNTTGRKSYRLVG